MSYRRATRGLRPRLSIYRTTQQPSTLDEIKAENIAKHGVLTQDKNMLKKLNEIEQSISYETPEEMMKIPSTNFAMMERKNREKVLNALKRQKDKGSSEAAAVYNQFLDIDAEIKQDMEAFYSKADAFKTLHHDFPYIAIIAENLKRMVKNDDDNIDNSALHEKTMKMLQDTNDSDYIDDVRDLLVASAGFTPLAVLENDLSNMDIDDGGTTTPTDELAQESEAILNTASNTEYNAKLSSFITKVKSFYKTNNMLTMEMKLSLDKHLLGTRANKANEKKLQDFYAKNQIGTPTNPRVRK